MEQNSILNQSNISNQKINQNDLSHNILHQQTILRHSKHLTPQNQFSINSNNNQQDENESNQNISLNSNKNQGLINVNQSKQFDIHSTSKFHQLQNQSSSNNQKKSEGIVLLNNHSFSINTNNKQEQLNNQSFSINTKKQNLINDQSFSMNTHKENQLVNEHSFSINTHKTKQTHNLVNNNQEQQNLSMNSSKLKQNQQSHENLNLYAGDSKISNQNKNKSLNNSYERSKLNLQKQQLMNNKSNSIQNKSNIDQQENFHFSQDNFFIKQSSKYSQKQKLQKSKLATNNLQPNQQNDGQYYIIEHQKNSNKESSQNQEKNTIQEINPYNQLNPNLLFKQKKVTIKEKKHANLQSSPYQYQHQQQQNQQDPFSNINYDIEKSKDNGLKHNNSINSQSKQASSINKRQQSFPIINNDDQMSILKGVSQISQLQNRQKNKQIQNIHLNQNHQINRKKQNVKKNKSQLSEPISETQSVQKNIGNVSNQQSSHLKNRNYESIKQSSRMILISKKQKNNNYQENSEDDLFNKSLMDQTKKLNITNKKQQSHSKTNTVNQDQSIVQPIQHQQDLSVSSVKSKQSQINIHLSQRLQQKKPQLQKKVTYTEKILSDNQKKSFRQPILKRQSKFQSYKDTQRNVPSIREQSAINVGYHLDSQQNDNKFRPPINIKDSGDISQQMISLPSVSSLKKIESSPRNFTNRNANKVQKKYSVDNNDQNIQKIFKQNEQESNINSCETPSYLNSLDLSPTPQKPQKVKNLISYDDIQVIQQESNILGSVPKQSMQMTKFKQTQSFFDKHQSQQIKNLVSSAIVNNIKVTQNDKNKQKGLFSIDKEAQQKFINNLKREESERFLQPQPQPKHDFENQQTVRTSNNVINSNTSIKQSKKSQPINVQINVSNNRSNNSINSSNKFNKQQKSDVQIEQQIIRSRKNTQNQRIYHQSQNYQMQPQPQNRKRVQTDFTLQINVNTPSNNKFTIINHPPRKQQSQEHGSSVFQTQIFPTNISLATSKLTKIREAKQYKRKKLEEELNKINDQIQILDKKQAEIKKYGSPAKNYNQRLKIDKNVQARQKAISMVRNFQKERKNKQIQKIQSIQKIDGKITNYMSQLTKIRSENQRKMKQKKKLQIIERMKTKEMMKMNQIKKKQASSKFVSQFFKNHQFRPSRQDVLSPQPEYRQVTSPTSRQRVPSKFQDYEDGLTPQLSNKKAYLNRVRNISQKKNRQNKPQNNIDMYQNKLY